MATITEMAKDRPTLLIVEDNEDDVFFVERIFKQIGARCELRFARDGIEAIDVSYLVDPLRTLPPETLKASVPCSMPIVSTLTLSISKARPEERAVSARAETVIKDRWCDVISVSA